MHGTAWKRPARSSPAGRLHPRDGALQRKKAGRGRRGQPPALDSLSGNKDSAKAERLPPSRRRTSRHLSFPDAALFTDGPQAGDPVNARSFCTSPWGRHGNGHRAQPVCRTKGALGGTAGAALASGAHRMTIATDITANITFIDRSRKTAGGTHWHDVPPRVAMTLSGSECPILLRDRSRSRVM